MLPHPALLRWGHRDTCQHVNGRSVVERMALLHVICKGLRKNTFYGQVSGTDEGAGPGSGPERAGIPAGDPVGFGLFCSGCPDRQGADSCTEGL